jgi:hypothetical protein
MSSKSSFGGGKIGSAGGISKRKLDLDGLPIVPEWVPWYLVSVFSRFSLPSQLLKSWPARRDGLVLAAPIAMVALILGSAGGVEAQDGSAGTREFAFVEIMTPARTMGLAENQVAVAEGADAVGINPAGLSRFEGRRGVAATLRVLTLGEAGGQVAYLFGPATGRFALSAAYLNAGDIEMKDESGADLGVIQPSAFSPALSYARIVNENWRLGASLKGYQEYLGDFEGAQSALGWGVDVGALYSPGAKNIGFGFAVVNAGRKFISHTAEGAAAGGEAAESAAGGGYTPATLKAGLFYTPPTWRKWRFIVETQADDTENPKFGAAAEWSPLTYLVARAGVRGNWQELRYAWQAYGEGKKVSLYSSEARRFGAGFTFGAAGMTLDYGVQWWQDLGFVHGLTVKRGWDG